VRPNRHISLGWTPGCPSVPRTPVEEPGHAGDARKATGAMPVVPSRHRSMPSRHRGHTGDASRHRGAPSRHRGHALGAAHLNGSGNDSGLDSVTACDRGGGKRTWREHSRALSAADRELRRVARHDEGGAAREGDTKEQHHFPCLVELCILFARRGRFGATMAHRMLLLLFASLAGSVSFTVRSHAPRFAARRTEGTAVLHPRVLPTASMPPPPPPPPPPSNESDEAEDKYLNACAAGVDSAEARLAMFRLEKLAQVALKV